ncbi:Uncharacterised protein [Edwardsiella tarda]|uniref:Uncharacterized protein n=1 Tax=Edwardsiella tarda ATCC 15947 = NBRC 105688 TaxID=667121 RepID=A0AC61TMW4_EDWTA|nr:hypothetical protein [Edwardsiella tarda]UAL58204.1 hypothetical protein K8O98_17140 [Edwardsiella tarda]UCQ02043.1 hypothetical protein DCL27_17270 [Edwardsiella tarda ATCC 15947 = NBRC 105688]STE53085.1 Uncharacterised protein [Edwardsiella tarda]
MNMKSKFAALLACTGLIASVGAYAGDWTPEGSITASFSITPPTGYTVSWMPTLKTFTSSEAFQKGVGVITLSNKDGTQGTAFGLTSRANLTDQAGKAGALTFTNSDGGSILATAVTSLTADSYGPFINGAQAEGTSPGGNLSTANAMFMVKPLGEGTLPAGNYSDVITVKIWN